MEERGLDLITKILLAGLLVCATMSVPGTAAADVSPLRSVAIGFMERGQELLAAGEYAQAVEHFRAALNCDPDLDAARQGLEQATERAGDEAVAAPSSEPVLQPETPGEAEMSSLPQPPAQETSQAGADTAGLNSPEALRTRAEELINAGQAGIADGDYNESTARFDQAINVLQPINERFPELVNQAEAGLRRARALQMEGLLSRSGDEPTLETAVPTAPAPDRSPPVPEERIDVEPGLQGMISRADRMVGEMMSTDLSEMGYDTIRPEPVSSRLRRPAPETSGLITRQPRVSDDDERTQKEIQARLKATRISVQFDGRPFEEAIDYMRAAGDLNIIVDPTILPTVEPVSLRMRNAPMESVLNFLVRLQNANLDWRIRDGAVFISNEEGLAERPVTMWHDISDLTIQPRDFNTEMSDGGIGTPEFQRRKDDRSWFSSSSGQDDVKRMEHEIEGDRWMSFIREAIAPGTWDIEGGVGQNRIAYRTGRLVVTHSPEVQEEIRELLASFRRARAVQVAIMARFIEVEEDFLDELSIRWTGVGPDGRYGFYRPGIRTQFGLGIDMPLESGPFARMGHQQVGEEAGMRLMTGFLNSW